MACVWRATLVAWMCQFRGGTHTNKHTDVHIHTRSHTHTHTHTHTRIHTQKLVCIHPVDAETNYCRVHAWQVSGYLHMNTSTWCVIYLHMNTSTWCVIYLHMKTSTWCVIYLHMKTSTWCVDIDIWIMVCASLHIKSSGLYRVAKTHRMPSVASQFSQKSGKFWGSFTENDL